MSGDEIGPGPAGFGWLSLDILVERMYDFFGGCIQACGI